MKIITASYFQPSLHTMGRKIGLVRPPQKLLLEYGYSCDLYYPDLSPCRFYNIYPDDFYFQYMKNKKEGVENAGEIFEKGYSQKLENFVKIIMKLSSNKSKKIFDLVGLKEGDNLLSWENGGHKTFRSLTAKYLRELGYDVEEK
jgi:hypothetical protein